MNENTTFDEWLKEFYPEVKLTPWQEEFIKASTDKSIVMMKMRQSGTTFIISKLVKYWEEMGYLK